MTAFFTPWSARTCSDDTSSGVGLPHLEYNPECGPRTRAHLPARRLLRSRYRQILHTGPSAPLSEATRRLPNPLGDLSWALWS